MGRAFTPHKGEHAQELVLKEMEAREKGAGGWWRGAHTGESNGWVGRGVGQERACRGPVRWIP